MSDGEGDTTDHGIPEATERLADELAAEDVPIVPRPVAVRELKTRTGADRIDHEEMATGFDAAGWAFSRQLYAHEPTLRDCAAAIEEDLRAANHLAITEEEVLDRIVADVGWDGEADQRITRGDEAGWRRGTVVSFVRGVFEGAGWTVHRANAEVDASRTFYFLPLDRVIRALHPNGRYPFSVEEIVQRYVSVAVDVPDHAE